MKYAVQQTERPDPFDPLHTGDKNPIQIKIGEIDLFGLLANCPSNREGGVFYFDASEPSEEIRDEETGELISFTPHYSPSDLWKSRDFNAYLWYIINKGNIGSPEAIQKSTWDNRVQAYKTYSQDESGDMENNFFHIQLNGGQSTWPPINTPNIPITGGTPSSPLVVHKKQIIICQYGEHSNADSNILNVWVNADRYYKTRKLKIYTGKKDKDGQKIYKDMYLNRTIFEFNYDYIFSLKLFDTKTLVANIVNSLLGLTSSLSISLSYTAEMALTKKKVEAIIDKIIYQDDTQSYNDDCFYTFDNLTYETLLKQTTEEYTGKYSESSQTYNPKFKNVFDALRGLSSTSKQQSGTTITMTTSQKLQSTLATVMEESYGLSGVKVTGGWEFTYGINFITDFLKQTIVQIVLQILSPKVAVLYAINSSVMGGDVANLEEWASFIKNSQNLIIQIVKQVKDIILKELYNFMMDKLSPILKLLIAKLALEVIKDYKDLIMNLILNCIPNLSPYAGASTTIDNVNYADIVPTLAAPTTKPC